MLSKELVHVRLIMHMVFVYIYKSLATHVLDIPLMHEKVLDWSRTASWYIRYCSHQLMYIVKFSIPSHVD